MNEYDDNPTNLQSPPQPNQSPSKDQKSAIAAAAVGVAALGGAAWGMSQFLSDDNGATTPDADGAGHADQGGGTGEGTTPPGNAVADNTLPPPNELGNGNGDQLPLVSPVNREEMTFEDAFREARHEMGANHYFEWHGHLYNTFYSEEWNQMSHNEQQTFLASVPHDDFPMGDTGGMLAGGEIPTPHAAHHAPHHDIEVAVHDDVPDPLDESDIIVEDHGSVHSAAHETPAGSHMPSDIDTATVELDGHEVVVFDADNDDHPDAVLFVDEQVLVVDTDHDHILDTRAVYNEESHSFGNEQNIEDQHITIDGSMDVLHNGGQPSAPVMADTHTDDIHMASHTDFDTDLGSDFDPDADISDYA